MSHPDNSKQDKLNDVILQMTALTNAVDELRAEVNTIKVKSLLIKNERINNEVSARKAIIHENVGRKNSAATLRKLNGRSQNGTQKTSGRQIAKNQDSSEIFSTDTAINSPPYMPSGKNIVSSDYFFQELQNSSAFSKWVSKSSPTNKNKSQKQEPSKTAEKREPASANVQSIGKKIRNSEETRRTLKTEEKKLITEKDGNAIVDANSSNGKKNKKQTVKSEPSGSLDTAESNDSASIDTRKAKKKLKQNRRKIKSEELSSNEPSQTSNSVVLTKVETLDRKNVRDEQGAKTPEIDGQRNANRTTKPKRLYKSGKPSEDEQPKTISTSETVSKNNRNEPTPTCMGSFKQNLGSLCTPLNRCRKNVSSSKADSKAEAEVLEAQPLIGDTSTVPPNDSVERATGKNNEKKNGSKKKLEKQETMQSHSLSTSTFATVSGTSAEIPIENTNTKKKNNLNKVKKKEMAELQSSSVADIDVEPNKLPEKPTEITKKKKVKDQRGVETSASSKAAVVDTELDGAVEKPIEMVVKKRKRHQKEIEKSSTSRTTAIDTEPDGLVEEPTEAASTRRKTRKIIEKAPPLRTVIPDRDSDNSVEEPTEITTKRRRNKKETEKEKLSSLRTATVGTEFDHSLEEPIKTVEKKTRNRAKTEKSLPATITAISDESDSSAAEPIEIVTKKRERRRKEKNKSPPSRTANLDTESNSTEEVQTEIVNQKRRNKNKRENPPSTSTDTFGAELNSSFEKSTDIAPKERKRRRKTTRSPHSKTAILDTDSDNTADVPNKIFNKKRRNLMKEDKPPSPSTDSVSTESDTSVEEPIQAVKKNRKNRKKTKKSPTSSIDTLSTESEKSVRKLPDIETKKRRRHRVASERLSSSSTTTRDTESKSSVETTTHVPAIKRREHPKEIENSSSSSTSIHGTESYDSVEVPTIVTTQEKTNDNKETQKSPKPSVEREVDDNSKLKSNKKTQTLEEPASSKSTEMGLLESSRRVKIADAAVGTQEVTDEPEKYAENLTSDSGWSIETGTTSESSSVDQDTSRGVNTDEAAAAVPKWTTTEEAISVCGATDKLPAEVWFRDNDTPSVYHCKKSVKRNQYKKLLIPFKRKSKKCPKCCGPRKLCNSWQSSKYTRNVTPSSARSCNSDKRPVSSAGPANTPTEKLPFCNRKTYHSYRVSSVVPKPDFRQPYPHSNSVPCPIRTGFNFPKSGRRGYIEKPHPWDQQRFDPVVNHFSSRFNPLGAVPTNSSMTSNDLEQITTDEEATSKVSGSRSSRSRHKKNAHSRFDDFYIPADFGNFSTRRHPNAPDAREPQTASSRPALLRRVANYFLSRKSSQYADDPQTVADCADPQSAGYYSTYAKSPPRYARREDLLDRNRRNYLTQRAGSYRNFEESQNVFTLVPVLVGEQSHVSDRGLRVIEMSDRRYAFPSQTLDHLVLD
ncbi:nucleolar protein dao-5-like [Neodiprion pinetum]|uniref:nucleolar protein dao-5-like n=1 Tax=Neodiprion pinetum TaxID=441929 RepID=UPI0037140BD6